MAADCTRAIDVWSFGCIVAELALGKPVFSGGSEFDHLHQIDALVGPLPEQLLSRSRKLMDYYETSGTPSQGSSFAIKTYEAFSKERGMVHKAWKGAPQRWPGVVRRLKDVAKVIVKTSLKDHDQLLKRGSEPGASGGPAAAAAAASAPPPAAMAKARIEAAAAEFADFLGKCLTTDPAKRVQVDAAAAHPFITAGGSRDGEGAASAEDGAAASATVVAPAPAADHRGESVPTGRGRDNHAADHDDGVHPNGDYSSVPRGMSTDAFKSLALLLQSPPRAKHGSTKGTPEGGPRGVRPSSLSGDDEMDDESREGGDSRGSPLDEKGEGGPEDSSWDPFFEVEHEE